MLKPLSVLAGLFCITVAYAEGAAIPTGKLPDTMRPTAYRIELTVDPAKKDFTGHTEIDATLAKATSTVFLHGLDLRVSKVLVTSGQTKVEGKYRQVDDSGVAQLDLPRELPAGKLTLAFDYSADFRRGAEGLFHVQVGADWYAWTQFEPIDARRMFPGFDEPGFKTPFTVTVKAPKSAKVFANTPETGAAAAGDSVTHKFAPTQPLPTYLVALGVGPFDVVESTIPPNAVRKQPLPWRVIGTKGQKARLQIAATEGPKLLTMIEQYTGIPFPFEKLDLLGTPILGGAMENAGLIIQDDTLMLLDANAPLSQLRSFAEVTAHEMAHQWFGDLVTPSWWTDIWLNESFAEWMGKKIGNQWRPDLGIAASELEEAFSAMDTDSLGKGRPIRQPITHNRQVASAFDEITYQKGGQVLSMFESYLGTEKFAAGVHKHLERYKNANATADDFFRSLGEAAGDPKIVPAMRTFTDQTGVPIIAVSQSDKGLTLTQTRYRPLGIAAKPAQTWKIPFCMSAGQTHSCSMLEAASTTIPAPASKAPLMPNAGGAGYYRFHLDPEHANRLIAEAAKLPAREALALADSLWADFAAGTGSFEQVVAAARALSAHPQRLAALELAGRMAELANSALTPEQVEQYRKVMQSIYAPRLAALGLDLKAGAYKNDPAEKQSLRTSLVSIVGLEARSPDVRAKLVTAAEAFINGDSQAVDPAFRPAAFAAAVQERGAPFMTRLRDMMVKSDDPLLRRNAAQAIATADTPATAAKAFDLAMGPGMQAMETLQIVLRSSVMPGAHDTIVGLVDKNFDKVMDTFPGFSRPAVLRIFSGECAANSVAKVDAFVNPKLKTIGGGELELAQTKERIGQCVALKQAKSAEISAVLAKAAT